MSLIVRTGQYIFSIQSTVSNAAAGSPSGHIYVKCVNRYLGTAFILQHNQFEVSTA